ncbi:SpoIIE family protein phosphatase [Paenibacillus alkaliterrae]|uniref:PP2C family protein-serine/threonine phosphatase n=1 Tax=Paenibacillus alkaliterrae TaxID=320909 RepID=UPI001F1A7B1E|nr:SpoIIE family protein phosphatase [Paenibacillus alkaliterrae]MCF2939399.1 SpoIIE family protein phosphatase [Paenibacillus alkaliterrae]
MNILRDIRVRLIGVYVAFAALGAAGMFFSNKYVHGNSEEQLAMVLRGLLVGFPVLVALLAGFTWVRLRIPSEKLEPCRMAGRDMRKWSRFTSFPKELFVWLVGCGMLLTQLQQLSVHGFPPWPGDIIFQYGKSTLFNLNTFVAFGMIHYSAARWVLRSRIRQLHIYHQDASSFRSAGVNMIFFLGCGLTYLLLCMLWYALSSESSAREPRQAVLFIILTIVFAVTFAVIYHMAFYLFRDMDLMTARLRELAGMKRADQRSRVPVASPYESGELTSAINSLQDRFEQEYARLDKDLDLAFRVQEQLFSHLMADWKDWKLNGSAGKPGEVGGGFYDALPLTEYRLALTAGTVRGHGLPSALVMSALVMLFRTTMNAAVGAGDLLTELNRTAAGFVKDGLNVHMTIAIIDYEQGSLEYASAGSMLVQVVQPGACLDDRSSADPLGSSPHNRYKASQMILNPGKCRVVLHSEDQSSLTARRGGGDRLGG